MRAQFFGHTHYDEFEIFYDNDVNASEPMRPTNVAYIGPSLTAFGNVNPGFRIYTINGNKESEFDVTDQSTYYLNLTQANLHRDSRPLHYQLAYDVRTQYNMTSLSPREWHNLVMKLKTDEKLFAKFYDYVFNRSDNIGDNHCHNLICKDRVLCRLVSAMSHTDQFCLYFFPIF